MALLEERGTDVQVAETARGTTRVYTLTPTVYCTVVTGHLEEPGADLIIRYGNARMRATPGKLQIFHDWLDMSGYETVSRQKLTEWSGKNADRVEKAHIALRSKIVAMGVQVANLALGGMIATYTDRGALEHALRRAVRGS